MDAFAEEDVVRQPQCVAQARADPLPTHSSFESNNYFKSVQWSPDGTTLLTNSADNVLRTYVLPTDLLSSHTHDEPKTFQAYSTQPFSEPISATAFYPRFDLADLSTTLHLSTPRGLPITLSQSIFPNAPTDTQPEFPQTLATYPLVHPETDTPITPSALLFHPYNPSVFLTGSSRLLCAFDLTRPHEGPMTRHTTAPSARKRQLGGLGGVGLSGIVGALAASADGGGQGGALLAAGTLSRDVGLYSLSASGGSLSSAVSIFSVAGDAAERRRDGNGVTSVAWSPDGAYLHVAERCSDVVQVYDVRVVGRRLGVLKGRRAVTNQRMGVEVVRSGDGAFGYEVWAGGTDGVVRVWRDPALHLGEHDGEMAPDYEFKAHDDAVASAVVHPSGTVAATCSGQRHPRRQDWDSSSDSDGDAGDGHGGSDDEDTSVDDSLKVWAR